MYGVGKFLRTRATRERFSPGAWRTIRAGRFVSRSLRGHAFQQFLRSRACEVSAGIWRVGAVGRKHSHRAFPHVEFLRFDDPERGEPRQTRRCCWRPKRWYEDGLIQCPNQGFTSAPANVRAVPNPDVRNATATWVSIVVRHAEGKSYLLELYARLFAEYKDIGLDYLIACLRRGRMRLHSVRALGWKRISRLTKEAAALGACFPDMKVILSTWLYDLPTSGEWDGLKAFVETILRGSTVSCATIISTFRAIHWSTACRGPFAFQLSRDQHVGP